MRRHNISSTSLLAADTADGCSYSCRYGWLADWLMTLNENRPSNALCCCVHRLLLRRHHNKVSLSFIHSSRMKQPTDRPTNEPATQSANEEYKPPPLPPIHRIEQSSAVVAVLEARSVINHILGASTFSWQGAAPPTE